MAIDSDQYVLGLDVPINNLISMQVCKSKKYFNDIEPNYIFR